MRVAATFALAGAVGLGSNRSPSRAAAISHIRANTDTAPTLAPCVSPRTGLDVCELRKGDILLETPSFNGSGPVLAAAWKLASFLGTYWFHIGIYDGRGRILEARGPNTAHPLREIEDTPVRQTGFYGTGRPNDAVDWVVLRLKPGYRSRVDGAVAWALAHAHTHRAGFIGETWLQEIAGFLDPRDKAQQSRFYCSLYVWRAFYSQGLDLDYQRASWRPDVPPPIGEILAWQVRPDGVYASAFGPSAATTVVQDRSPWPRRAWSISTNYELLTAVASGYLFDPTMWVVAGACLLLLTRLRHPLPVDLVLRRARPAHRRGRQPWPS